MQVACFCFLIHPKREKFIVYILILVIYLFFLVSEDVYAFSFFFSSIESPKIQSPVKEEEKEGSKLPSNPEEVEDLRRDAAANPLISFTFDELKIITANFRQDYYLGGGGFGSVHKGFITEDLREGFQPLQVAVKVHDGDNSYQGHREWLVTY